MGRQVCLTTPSCALDDYRIRAALLCISHQIFEFAGFISARRKPSAIVTFDPKARATKKFAEPIHRL